MSKILKINKELPPFIMSGKWSEPTANSGKTGLAMPASLAYWCNYCACEFDHVITGNMCNVCARRRMRDAARKCS